MKIPLGLAAFDHQSRLAHVLTVLGGLLVFWLGYFGAVAVVYGDPSVLGLESSIDEQRVGGAVGAVFVWSYFALAFVRGYGGPVLNAFAYPLVIAAVTPHLARWALFGVDTAAVVSRFVGLFVLEPLVTTVLVVAPGASAFLLWLSLWAARVGDAERREWERYHLSDAFYEEFVAGERE
ncbi:hypothetical protein [Natrononativus amylolyticus]|uniref:hypothetical protein n=1 Tax=Natrononativus amylolyticus TaxID=2963434 RepID=UPI0020CCAF30|nr:hypothetical protein [Natrononativus amylolyticus]